MRTWISVAALLVVTPTAFSQPPTSRTDAAPPDTDIFLAPLTTADGRPSVGTPENITNTPGYDNQPSFTPDGGAVLFTSNRGGKQTDIYRYDISTRRTTRVTNTPESEYSPTVTPDRQHISVIRVEADQTQRLWQFTLDGADPSLVLADVKPVGYHAWLDDHTLALFVLGQPPTLQIADTKTGKAEIFARDIGRSLQRIPTSDAVSFVQREAASEAGAPPILWIRAFDSRVRQITELVRAVAGATEADTAWLPDGTMLMAYKDTLYGWKLGQRDWMNLADLGALGMHHVSRLAVSPRGDRLALVVGP
jgi:dipeptidyl aminopeptidase/acylaminoacyl peptidase